MVLHFVMEEISLERMPSNGGFYDDRDTRILVEDIASIDVTPVDEDHERSPSSSSGHCHDDEHSLEDGVVCTKSRRSERVLWAVAALSALFIGLEFTGGILADSLAIMTDAGHMLSDLLSFVISIMAIRTARRPSNRKFPYGYDRAEVLGALISVIILWVLTTILVLLAIERIANNHLEVEADTMLITAGAGVGFNIIMAIVLHLGSAGHAHSHGGGASHGHSHGGTGGNVNVRAALIHVIGDLIQSVGVLIAAIVIKFTGWALADPICTFFFSIIVLFTTITVLRDIFYVLMEATPRHMDFNAVRDDLMGLEGVLQVHDLHLWSLNMDKTAMAVHLAIDDNERALAIVQEARDMIRLKYNVKTATVQVEQFDKSMDNCTKCTR